MRPDMRVLPVTPVPRGLLPYGGIRVVQQSAVGECQVPVPLARRHSVPEPGPLRWEDAAHVPREPLDLTPGRVRDAEQDDLRDRLRMLLGVRESECRAP